VYGSDGHDIVNDTTSYPAYAQASLSGQAAWTWVASTSDVRALQKAATSDRIAATWYAGDTFSIDLNLTDGLTHRVAMYFVDWDASGRTETIEIHDAATNALLDSRVVAGFNGGQYLVWNVQGHVVVKVIKNAGVNAILSGLFFGS